MRTTIDVSDSLHAKCEGHKLADKIVRNVAKSLPLVDLLVAHDSTATYGRSSSPRSRRWVVDSGSYLDIIG